MKQHEGWLWRGVNWTTCPCSSSARVSAALLVQKQIMLFPSYHASLLWIQELPSGRSLEAIKKRGRGDSQCMADYLQPVLLSLLWLKLLPSVVGIYTLIKTLLTFSHPCDCPETCFLNSKCYHCSVHWYCWVFSHSLSLKAFQEKALDSPLTLKIQCCRKERNTKPTVEMEVILTCQSRWPHNSNCPLYMYFEDKQQLSAHKVKYLYACLTGGVHFHQSYCQVPDFYL